MTTKRPQKTGGVLIRRLVKFFRDRKLDGHSISHIHIATSAGSDSLAVAHLLVHYGSKIIAKEAITLIHVNHHWREPISTEEAEYVRSLAKLWGVKAKILSVGVSRLKPIKGDSKENAARRLRKDLLAKERVKQGPNTVTLTAHHANDRIETLVWRFFTGQLIRQPDGILEEFEGELRPLLSTFKAELQQYLKEEGVRWFEDETNQSTQYLRGALRAELFPIVKKQFPNFERRLMQLGDELSELLSRAVSGTVSLPPAEGLPIEVLPQMASLRLTPEHRIALQKLYSKKSPGEVHLPGNWILRKEKTQNKENPYQYLLTAK